MNPNKQALAEIAKMPSLAGCTPRTIFHTTVVMADLHRKPRGLSEPMKPLKNKEFDRLSTRDCGFIKY